MSGKHGSNVPASRGGFARRLKNGTRKDKLPLAAQAKWFLLLGDLLKVGFSLQRAISFTIVVMKKHRPILGQINKSLMAGESFADSVKPFVKADRYYQLLLAEQHGELIETLNELGKLLVAEQHQKQKLQRLLQYPLLLLFLLGLLLIGLSSYVFPELATWQTGPAPAMWTAFRAALPVVCGALALIASVWLTTTLVRWWRFDADQRASWLCQLPIVGRCYRLYYGYYVVSTLAILLQCGMSLKEILLVVDRFSAKSLLNCLGQHAQRQVQAGGDLRSVIDARVYLPDELQVLVNQGMTVQELGNNLMMLGKMQLHRLLVQIEGLLGMVQPVIFIIIAVIIVGLYLSILLPIYQSIQGVY